MKQQQQQEQLKRNEERARREEYEAAQRAAIESINVGRATAEAVDRQGEQLSRTEQIADDTQYKIDRAARLLKGMTWSGWVGNMFSSDVKAPESLAQQSSLLQQTRDGAQLPSLDHYENLPTQCQETAQAIQNYRANVMVLLECETEEQKKTCVQICDCMYQSASAQIRTQLMGIPSTEAYALQLQADLDVLRQRQLKSQSQVRVCVDRIISPLSSDDKESQKSLQSDKLKEELFGQKAALQPATAVSTTKSGPTTTRVQTVQEQMQEEHLQVISQSLGELHHIAHSLSAGLIDQRQVIDSLDSKSESVLETSKMVGRRADRLIQKKSWTPVKAVFSGSVAIRHVETGKFLSVIGCDLFLVNKYNPANGTFALHKRQGAIFGLQSHSKRKWIGQSFLTGSLTCSAATFGRREEWEADHGTSSTTRLLCASAGWGQGAYLQVRETDFAVLIGGSTLAESKKAANWSIITQDIEVDVPP